ncbi:MAG TPA: HAMP domain-containing sensor histidine kinase [Gemmatimonadaceae bacterium]|nr:HAMP domain-containing sensor histidine kinase [Gemmatimonadaceae bacterium]
MLHQFLTDNHDEIVRRARAKVALRVSPQPTSDELESGIPLFLGQLEKSLRNSTPASTAAIDLSASMHGADLHRLGFTIGQVVHDYGDVCQAVTELAEETQAPITIDEFHTLNRCLDEAIAGAVTAFHQEGQQAQREGEVERSESLAHEMRNRLGGVMLAYRALADGRVGVGGSTARVLERNLRGMRELIERSIAESRIEGGKAQRERVSVTELVAEIAADASLEAASHGIDFHALRVPAGLFVETDRAILGAAAANLLQNAFKFSHSGAQVSLTVTDTPDRVLFEVRDECGGLPGGQTEELFVPYVQASANRHGLGLGLAISRKGIESCGGELRARDLPGKGCVFTIAVPRSYA